MDDEKWGWAKQNEQSRMSKAGWAKQDEQSRNFSHLFKVHEFLILLLSSILSLFSLPSSVFPMFFCLVAWSLISGGILTLSIVVDENTKFSVDIAIGVKSWDISITRNPIPENQHQMKSCALGRTVNGKDLKLKLSCIILCTPSST